MGEKIVLDIETQRGFSEVEGRKPELLGISVVGIYRYGKSGAVLNGVTSRRRSERTESLG